MWPTGDDDIMVQGYTDMLLCKLHLKKKSWRHRITDANIADHFTLDDKKKVDHIRNGPLRDFKKKYPEVFANQDILDKAHLFRKSVQWDKVEEAIVLYRQIKIKVEGL